MIDNGWAGTFPKLLHLLRQKDININEIKYLIITHFHPDHAGIVQDIKECGAKLILHICQVPFISEFKRYFKPQHNFRNIEPTNNIIATSEESRIFFSKLGIEGEIIRTPGHSDDSVSLIIDKCCAFTGDLPSLSLVGPDGNSKLKDSWTDIKSYGVERIYPGHGNSFSI